VQKKKKMEDVDKTLDLQRPVAGAYNGLIMDLSNIDEISYKKTSCGWTLVLWRSYFLKWM